MSSNCIEKNALPSSGLTLRERRQGNMRVEQCHDLRTLPPLEPHRRSGCHHRPLLQHRPEALACTT